MLSLFANKIFLPLLAAIHAAFSPEKPEVAQIIISTLSLRISSSSSLSSLRKFPDIFDNF